MNTRTNRNELMSRLLSGITTSELQNFVRMQEEARRPIPAVQMGIDVPDMCEVFFMCIREV